MVEALFWLSLFLIAYCYAGYPILLLLWAKIAPKPVIRGEELPCVSLVIAAHNEAKVIADKLRNAQALDYPAEKLEILVGSDGSTDGTEDVARSAAGPSTRVLHWAERRGKVSVLNELVPEASGEIILFSDARQLYFPDAIRRLVAPFSDSKVGCVSGGLEILPLSYQSVGEGVGFYRVYEQILRELEGRIHSMLGATGAIYAIRRALYVPPMPDTILDDFEIPMRIVARGYRAIFEPMAVAYDRPPSNASEEMARKVRTLAGNYQSLIRLRRLLLPLRSPVAVQLLSHKVLRLLVPFLMIAAAGLNLKLALDSRFYEVVLAIQMLFYASGAIGSMLRTRGRFTRFLGIAYTFILLNYAALLGFIRFVSGRQQATWKRAAAEHSSRS